MNRPNSPEVRDQNLYRLKRHPELQPYLPSDRFTTVPRAKPRPQQQPKQPQKQKRSRKNLPDRPPITPITSVRPSVVNTPISPTSVNTETPQSSTPVVVRGTKITKGARPSLTPAVQLPTPASSLEEELESASKSKRSDITRDIVIEPSISEQVSEMSLNDPFYQSAASDIVLESEKSTNGIDYDRNAESLCRELQEDLLANGFISRIDQDEFKSPELNDRGISSPQRVSNATIVTSDNLAQSETSQQGSEDDDRRLRIEKELREKAKQEDDDRRKREEIVENILSRFSQGSVS